MDSFTPEQEQQLKTWAAKRDAILGELGILETEKGTLLKTNKELGESNTEIQTKIIESEGRMIELDKKEKEQADIISLEIGALEKRKSVLDAVIPTIQKEIDSKNIEKDKLVKDIEFLTKTHAEVFSRTGILEQIIENVTKTSSLNQKELGEFVDLLKNKVEEILKLSTTNISAHTEILNSIPAMFVELRRKTLQREKI